jgi:hypothetical protein
VRLLTGVRYVYAASAPSQALLGAPAAGLTREALAALPAELREALEAAAVRARHDRLLELAGQVEALDPECGAQLRRVLAGFDYAALLRALGAEAS